jgi:hypothetical protein
MQLEELGTLKEFQDIGNEYRDLEACSVVPQPTTLQRAHRKSHNFAISLISFEEERKAYENSRVVICACQCACLYT